MRRMLMTKVEQLVRDLVSQMNSTYRGIVHSYITGPAVSVDAIAIY